jgi:hypothetical protein
VSGRCTARYEDRDRRVELRVHIVNVLKPLLPVALEDAVKRLEAKQEVAENALMFLSTKSTETTMKELADHKTKLVALQAARRTSSANPATTTGGPRRSARWSSTAARPSARARAAEFSSNASRDRPPAGRPPTSDCDGPCNPERIHCYKFADR